jgi:hypothetical protein
MLLLQMKSERRVDVGNILWTYIYHMNQSIPHPSIFTSGYCVLKLDLEYNVQYYLQLSWMGFSLSPAPSWTPIVC